MSPDANAYVAIPMDGMRMSSSADPSARRRSSSSNSKAWILAGLTAVVLLLGLFFLMTWVDDGIWVGYGCHGTMEQQMYSSDTIVMVVDEPAVEEDLDIGVMEEKKDVLVEKPKIEMYKGKPIVLKEEKGEIVETYDNIVDGDYENEMDDEYIIENENEEEEEPDEGASIDEREPENDDIIIIEYESDEEEFTKDDAMYDDDMYPYDEAIDDRVNELSDDDAMEELPEMAESFDEQPLEELTKEDVVTVERMGGN